jgi:hypothetical protein
MDIISSNAQVLIKDSTGSSGVNIWSALGGHAAVLAFWGHGAYLTRVKGYNDLRILILPNEKWKTDAKTEGFEIIGRLSDLVQVEQQP